MAVFIPIISFAVTLAGAGFKVRSEAMSFHKDYLEQAKSAYAKIQSKFIQESLNTIMRIVKKNSSATGFDEGGLQKDISSVEFENNVRELSKITLESKDVMDTFDQIWKGKMKIGNSLFILAFVVGANVVIFIIPDQYQGMETAIYFLDAIGAVYAAFQYRLFRFVSSSEERFLTIIQGQTF